MKSAGRFLVSWLYVGRRFVCPCCGMSLRRMMATPSRANARCPRCRSLHRHRLLWLYLRDRLSLLTQPLSLLHFAPQTGLWTRLNGLTHIRYITADLRSDDVSVRVDMCRLPFADGSIDLVLSSAVLDYIPDDVAAMREIHRVLRVGGIAVLWLPVDDTVERTLDDPREWSPRQRANLAKTGGAVRVYGWDVCRRLESVGFAVTVERYARDLDSDTVQRYVLLADDPIIVCRKACGQGCD